MRPSRFAPSFSGNTTSVSLYPLQGKRCIKGLEHNELIFGITHVLLSTSEFLHTKAT
jgi:hypothetical protein